MNIPTLSAISPVDGRYRGVTGCLADYFSESALIRYRLKVEVEYFIALSELALPPLSKLDEKTISSLRSLYRDFSIENALNIKGLEKITNHDVKAVEYFLKERFEEAGLSSLKEFVHFGLTSQDVNNTAIPGLIKDAFNTIIRPQIDDTVSCLEEFSKVWKNIPMLARTHGQPASPTTLGKEIYVFADRIKGQLALLDKIPFSAKFGGATGNFNAHYVAYPDINWHSFGDNFVENILGLKRTRVTTQIEPYDNTAAFFDSIKRINTILIDLNRDIWTYISMNYFKQRIKAGEVGSSAMPHKVNPIDFENSEGNLGFANAVFEHLASKLPVSRLQRDLTDSTVLRNVGLPFAHTLIALVSLKKGLGKLVLNRSAIKRDLDENWAVVAEALQTVLRREGYPSPYEALKELTRTNEEITKNTISGFIDSLEIKESVKEELKKITPENYTGVCYF